MDFILWGFMKSEVYTTPVNSEEGFLNMVKGATQNVQATEWLSEQRLWTCKLVGSILTFMIFLYLYKYNINFNLMG